MVKDQINVAVLFFDADVLLPGDKGEPVAEFDQKTLQMGDDGPFKV